MTYRVIDRRRGMDWTVFSGTLFQCEMFVQARRYNYYAIVESA